MKIDKDWDLRESLISLFKVDCYQSWLWFDENPTYMLVYIHFLQVGNNQLDLITYMYIHVYVSRYFKMPLIMDISDDTG